MVQIVAGLQVVAADSGADADTCRVLVIGGTGEATVFDRPDEIRGMLAAVTVELSERFVPEWLPYPASYGPVVARDGISVEASVDRGVAALTARLAEIDRPVFLIGYSQGCMVIRRVLAAIYAGSIPRGTLIGVGLVADPQQPIGADPRCTGYGVAGQGPAIPIGVAVRWIAHPRDVICNAAPDSFVRDIADATATMALADVRGWLLQALRNFRSHRFQNAPKTTFSPRQWRRDLVRLRVAVLEILGYLPTVSLSLLGWVLTNRAGGRHVGYGTEPYEGTATGCQVLARWIERTDRRYVALSSDRAADVGPPTVPLAG